MLIIGITYTYVVQMMRLFRGRFLIQWDVNLTWTLLMVVSSIEEAGDVNVHVYQRVFVIILVSTKIIEH